MNADPQLRDRFERAAGSMDVDAASRLDRVRVAATRRDRSRRMQALAVAAAIAIAILAVAWQVREGGSTRVVLGGTTTGRIAFLGSQGSADRTLFTIDLAGGNPVGMGEETVPRASWSPDGSRLATIVEEPGSPTRYTVVVSDAVGDPANPMDWGALVRKFRSLTKGLMPAAGQEAIIAAVQSLPGRGVAQLHDRLAAPLG